MPVELGRDSNELARNCAVTRGWGEGGMGEGWWWWREWDAILDGRMREKCMHVHDKLSKILADKMLCKIKRNAGHGFIFLRGLQLRAFLFFLSFSFYTHCFLNYELRYVASSRSSYLRNQHS
jgi:hypothetical protein